MTVQGALWQRKGWKEMDKMRAQLEDLRELRDLVRSLGRGGGWGPLRRAPVQYLDMKGRPGLLRTILEQQETRGLTRSDDISRLLPSEVRPTFLPWRQYNFCVSGTVACAFLICFFFSVLEALSLKHSLQGAVLWLFIWIVVGTRLNCMRIFLGVARTGMNRSNSKGLLQRNAALQHC